MASVHWYLIHYFRFAFWPDADQSWTGLSAVQISDQCEREDAHSSCDQCKVIHTVSCGRDVVENQQ